MTERPIIFSGPMVRAILEGRKTQTRRLVSPQPATIGAPVRRDVAPLTTSWPIRFLGANAGAIHCPYGERGDRLWVRESTRRVPIIEGSRAMCGEYVADGERVVESHGFDISWWRAGYANCPAIFMPREAARLVLEVVAVRVERLQTISEADAKAEGMFVGARSGRWTHDEGVDAGLLCGPVGAYRALWDRINAKRGRWLDNPWVWVVEFRRTK